MISLKQIEKWYPEDIHPFKRAMVKEYLQYKILELVFASKYARKLSFIGGTALRLLYDNQRFSEDIDFDNFALSEHEFEGLAEYVKNGLKKDGLEVDMNLAGKEAYRCNIRFPGVLFEEGLSPHHDEKILIQIDSLAQGFKYAPERKILNKFDVFTEIFSPSIDILLSQKIYASMSRKRAKGRDFYDIVFLASITKPNYEYLKLKMNISEPTTLKNKMIEEASKLDFDKLAEDVAPFLFATGDRKRVEKFREFIMDANF